MGKLITAWSPYHGQCKTTASLVALAGTMGNTAAGTSLITHIQPKMSNMENMFGLSEQSKEGIFEDTGLNSLIYNATARKISGQDVELASVKITSNLWLLPSFGQYNDAHRNNIVLYIITEVLPQYYDYVFVDLGTETGELVQQIREAADSNFIVLSQNKMLWKRYDIKNARYLLSGYEEASKYNLHNFKWNVSSKVDVVPFCVEYMDAISSGDVSGFFLRNENLDTKRSKTDGVRNFFQRLKEVKL